MCLEVTTEASLSTAAFSRVIVAEPYYVGDKFRMSSVPCYLAASQVKIFLLKVSSVLWMMSCLRLSYDRRVLDAQPYFTNAFVWCQH